MLLFYSWRNDAGSNEPGVLDHIVYSDSVLSAAHSFVLNTTLMPAEALEAAGLGETDVMLDLQSGDYDHLPLVADFQSPP